MSHNEVADVTGWPLGTVKSYIARGKAKIRERFGIGDES
jgi:DNA-directed RNA polymerase specialized sigma24 family protein